MALVVPEVFADAVLANLNKNLKLRGLATDATEYVGEIRNDGDTVHFPEFLRNATAVKVTKGVPLTPSNLDMSDNEAKIYQIAASKRVFDAELHQVKGVVLDGAAQELADAMALKMDTDLGSAVLAGATLLSPTASATTISYAEYDAARNLFGDQQDTDTFAGVVANSKLRSSFFGMEQFVKNDYTYYTMSNGIVVNGCIGFLEGIPVFLSDNGTFDTTKNECVTLMLKKNALQYVLQQDIAFEEQRPSLVLATDLIVSSLYACKLVHSNGAVVIRKTVTP